MDERLQPGVEVVDGEPVPAAGALERAAAPGALEVSSRQVAVLAAGGFVAGVATVAVLGRRGAPRRRRRRKGALGQIVSTNSFLVDVHVLKR